MKLKHIIPLILWLLLLIRSGYYVLVEEKAVYEKYNGMKGVVLWSTFAPRSGVYLCGVQLEDGTTGDVNAGARPIQKGDVFINQINYGWIMGMSGMAYCIVPDEGSGMFWQMIWAMSLWAIILGIVVFGLIKIYGD